MSSTEPIAKVDDSRVRSFLVDSLGLWQVAGTVTPADPPAIALIVAPDGTRVWVERADDGSPFRWMVRWRQPGHGSGYPRENLPRACSSLVGMLNAVRRALGVDVGEPLRIVSTSHE